MKKFFITLAALSALCWYATAGEPNREQPEKPVVKETPYTIVVILPNGKIVVIQK